MLAVRHPRKIKRTLLPEWVLLGSRENCEWKRCFIFQQRREKEKCGTHQAVLKTADTSTHTSGYEMNVCGLVWSVLKALGYMFSGLRIGRVMLVREQLLFLLLGRNDSSFNKVCDAVETRHNLITLSRHRSGVRGGGYLCELSVSVSNKLI